MGLTTFLLILTAFLLPYYLLLILVDWIKIQSTAKLTTVGNHEIHYEPVVETSVVNNSAVSAHCQPVTETIPENRLASSNGVLVDLGLETISGESYEISSESLAKYMTA